MIGPVLLTISASAAALFSPISDCDETYNYWEPMHYMLEGVGFQTWEYSPQYALRSYAYLLPHAAIAKLALYLGADKITAFYIVRFVLALLYAYSTYRMYRSIRDSLGRRSVAELFLWFMIVSPGVFISSAAFLPSSTAAFLMTLSVSSWMDNRPRAAIVWTAASALIAWPFTAALGIPLALDVILGQRRLWLFITQSLTVFASICIPLILIDHFYYDRAVLAPLNIVAYNVLSSETSSELYGTEPWHYYIKNLLLNFNLVFALALYAPVALLTGVASESASNARFAKYLAPMAVWFGIFESQAHKEERFMFPVYSLICLAGAVSLDSLLGLINSMLRRMNRMPQWAVVAKVVRSFFIFAVVNLSLSRIAALHLNYGAPLSVYAELNHALARLSPEDSATVCIGKEWYRFPSHFFIDTDSVRVEFIESEFRGQLPAHYSAEYGTSGVPPYFNHMNKEEPSRYIPRLLCDFIVDLEVSQTSSLEPNFSKLGYKPVVCQPFLAAEYTPTLARTLHIPWVTPRQRVMAEYCVYRENAAGESD